MALAGNYLVGDNLFWPGEVVMNSSALAAGLRQLRGRMAARQRREESDEQLLHAFLSRRDESAFAILVNRHGPMVLHVCRRVLGHEQDAEDAFQATFLVLARSAASLRSKTSLASFLHGIAYRTAMKAKQSATRRRKHENQAPSRPPADPAEDLSWREVRALLDEEITRLPEIYRSVFVLCHLEDLSRAEAAQRLGLKECTVFSRLAGARKRLSQRLSRRGVELSAVLAASALAAQPASALQSGLMASTLKAALAIAADDGIAGVVSASVVELVKSMTVAMMVSKAKIAAIVFLALSLLGGAGVWLNAQTHATAPLPGPPPGAKADERPQAAPSKPEQAKTVEFRGQVVDPDGKPFAGAKVYLAYPAPKKPPIPARATSDVEGRFRFRVARSDFERSDKPAPWTQAVVVATAKDYGLGLSEMLAVPSESNTTLMLGLAKDDAPLSGRVLDLQGKPVAGVTVRVHGLYAPRHGDLAAFVGALKDKKEFFSPLNENLFGFDVGGRYDRDVDPLFPSVKTGEDGRFEIKGVGCERLASLRIEGPTIATRDVYAMTQTADTIHLPGWRRYEPRTDKLTVYGNGFDHIAAPCRPIVGIVRDKDTGNPIPGAVVTSYKRPDCHFSAVTDLRAVTDKNGRYRLLGMPKGQGNVIRAGSPEDEPYLMATQEIADTPGLGPITADFTLKRGVWISGRVLDRTTRRPLHAQVEYVIFADNPHRKEAPELSVEEYLQSWFKDGTFRVAALPGRGLLAARSWSDKYRMGVGADNIKGMGPDGHFLTYPHLLFARHYHTLVEVNPAVGAKQITCNLLLDPGQSLTGEVHGPDGKPLAGVRVSGLRSYGGHGLWEHEPLKTSAFTVTGLGLEQSRLLEFIHIEKKLAGSVTVKGDDKGPLVVKLAPAAALTGRLVTPEGKPVADGEVTARHEAAIGSLPAGIRPDKDGKFRIEGLVPGLTYRLGLVKGMYLHRLDGAAGGELTFEQGQTRDLGDVVVKPIE
jgi:RNA polymerase sigma factor (sigma-70 family)